METRRFRRILIVTLSLLLMFVSIPACGQRGWPIDPMNQGHPIGNSFGEFQDFGSCYDKNGYLMPHCIFQHSGIDIIGTPMYQSNGTENPSAPWVRVTVGGVVEDLIDIPNTNQNFATIRDANGVVYRYEHLEHNSYDQTFRDSHDNQTIAVKGSPIAKLYRWNDCDYHHLHYETEGNAKFLNPLASIVPHQDGEIPQIVSISFAVNNSGSNSNNWVPLNTVDPQGRTVVSGEVDIIAEIRDRDRAGSNHSGTETLWVYNIRWRACPESNPDCPWNNTYAFNDMPVSWNGGNNEWTSAYFSVNSPWVSDSNYCQKTSLYGVVTNFVGGTPDKAGYWDTGKIPDGNYIVSVEATDFAAKTVQSSAKVRVLNGSPPGAGSPPSAPTDLRIR